MVFPHQPHSSRKRGTSSSFLPPFRVPKVPKSTEVATPAVAPVATLNPLASQSLTAQRGDAILASGSSLSKVERMVSVLADAGCTLVNPSGPPSLPSDSLKFRRHLHRIFSSDSEARSDFLDGFSSYIQTRPNIRRVLITSKIDGSYFNHVRSGSLVRNLLLIPSLQMDIQDMLLEKLPEYLMDSGDHGLSSSFEDDIARLILNQFRWLDFIIDSTTFTDKLLQVLSVFPIHLKREVIGSLPEMIGDQNVEAVLNCLQQMLQEDPAIIASVLDAFANLNLDTQLHDQVITVALSCIGTVDAEYMPHLLRFLLLSATRSNVGRIISQIREHLKFVGLTNTQSMQQAKNKGKSILGNAEASILDSLRSSLRFNNVLSENILKELKSLKKPRDHKLIDVWLLVLIHMDGETLRKSVEKLFAKKVIEGCINMAMFDQCVRGNMDLAKEYFPSLLSLSEHMLACKEQEAQKFGVYMYICQFEEFTDAYFRQEISGALVSHIGSSHSFEVYYALEVLLILASKYPQELVPMSSHIYGILDFLEGFTVENLRKVYEIFSLLTLSGISTVESFRTSLTNQLLMIVRKQVSNPDLRYKKMGIIGTLKVVSFIGNDDNAVNTSFSQKLNYEEAVELLKSSLDCCKQLPLLQILYYDELSALLNSKSLHSSIMGWMVKHLGDFESLFLSDIDGDRLRAKELYCGLEGELWMNLDSDISPVCLNILPLCSSSIRSAAMLEILPAYFSVVAMIERIGNQGSLGGIDALLGCPLYLPSSKYFSPAEWQCLSGKQKELICLCLYHACNWLRELLNAFSTQVTGKSQCISQVLKEEITSKLLKRLRNIVFLESLLYYALQQHPCILPELYHHGEETGCSSLSLHDHRGNMHNKNGYKKMNESNLLSGKGKHKIMAKVSSNLDAVGNSRQPSVFDALKKSGIIAGDEVHNDDSYCQSLKSVGSESGEYATSISESRPTVEVGISTALDSQRKKFRPLYLGCHSILSFGKDQVSCCPDPADMLSLHSYLLHDLHYKLDNISRPSHQCSFKSLSVANSMGRMEVNEMLISIKPLFSILRRYFDAALSILKGTPTCQEHWKVQATLAAHPELTDISLVNSSVSYLIVKETLSFLSKVSDFICTQMEVSLLFDLLEAFQPIHMEDDTFSGIMPVPLPGTIEYLYCGAFCFLEGVFDSVSSLSFNLASEILLTVKSLVYSAQSTPSDSVGSLSKVRDTGAVKNVGSILQNRLGTLACKLLRHKGDESSDESGWRSQVDKVEKILRIYLQSCNCSFDVLYEMACSVLPQAIEVKMIGDDGYHGYPTLCSATILVWYKTLHEENIYTLNRLLRCGCCTDGNNVQPENVEEFLSKLQQSVKVLVSLVSMCRVYDKSSVRSMAVKYGGKFFDSFLRVFSFLQTHFEKHHTVILQLVKELQKATRTIQTVCSEAKGCKQTAITSKIPATKRCMEKFLFHVKALLHTTSSGCTFWMGNLRHKDLSGQEISSQAYIDNQDEDDFVAEADDGEQSCPSTAEDHEAE